MRIIVLVLCIFVNNSAEGFAQSAQVGKITQLTGAADLFTHPSKINAPQGPPPHALFEGELYSVKKVNAGDAIENGNILRTAPGTNLKVVYANGDQIHVGGGTSYRVKWNEGSQTPPQVQLGYGKLKAMIEKGGPRAGLTLRTKSASMGVRGTEFVVEDQIGEGRSTTVTVIRGEVSMAPIAQPSAVQSVPAGFSALSPEVVESTHAQVKQSERAQVEKTSKEELSTIQQTLILPLEKKNIAEVAPSVEVKAEIKQLEESAVQATLRDLEKTDPELYKKVQGKSVRNSEEIQLQVIEKVAMNAPAVSRLRKPSRREFEELHQQDPYKKYPASQE